MKDLLKDPTLLRTQAYINGAWVDSDSGETFPVHNPATQKVIAEVASFGAAETRRAIEAAEVAQKPWAALSAMERSAVLKKWNDLILENVEDLAIIMTQEQGKVLAESRGEIVYAASFIEWFAEEGKRVYGDVFPLPQSSSRGIAIKQPVGVVAAVTPWNFPSAMLTRKCGPALAVGCAMVAKPAHETPLSMLALAELADRAGLPAGLLSVVPGAHSAVFRVHTRWCLTRTVTAYRLREAACKRASDAAPDNRASRAENTPHRGPPVQAHQYVNRAADAVSSKKLLSR